MKKGGLGRPFYSNAYESVTFAGERHDQLQQADENVVDAEVN